MLEDNYIRLLDSYSLTKNYGSEWNTTFKVENPPKSLISNCDAAVLLGGFNIFKGSFALDKTFDTSRTPSLFAIIQFDIIFIDSWEKEKLLLKINGQTVWTFQPENRISHYYNLCGNFTYDDQQHFSHFFRHSEPYLTIEIIPEEPFSEGSWGITNFSIDLEVPCQYNSLKTTTKSCSCASGLLNKLRNEEKCPKQLYDSNFCFDCLVCPIRCKTCRDLEICLECLNGFVLIDGKCDTPDGKN